MLYKMKTKLMTFYLIFFMPLYLCAQEKKNTSDVASFGTVLIESDIPEAEVYIGNEFKGITPLKLDNLKFAHQYTFTIKKNGYRTVKKNVTTYKFRPEIRVLVIIGYAKLLVKRFPIDANLTIDDKIVNNIQTDTISINPGKHNIQVNKDEYYKHKEIINFKSETFHSFDITLKPKSKNRAMIYSSGFPGIGQYYLDKEYKALTYFSSEIITLYMFNYFNNRIKDLKSKYNSTYSLYLASTNDEEVGSYHNKINKILDDIDINKTIREIFLISAVSIWILNIVDVYLWNEPNIKSKNISLQIDYNSRQNNK